MELRTYKKTSKEDRDKVIHQLIAWRQAAERDNQPNYERMLKARDFEDGHQWDLSLKDEMESKGKMCVTVPLIRPQVLQLVGYVVSNPKDISVKNVKAGDKLLADLKTRVAKHVLDRSNGYDSLVDMFHKGCGRGDGYIGLLKDESDPRGGNLAVKVLNEFDCLPDCTSQMYDLNGTEGSADGSKYFFWDEWVDMDWAHKKWPHLDKAKPQKDDRFISHTYSGITQMLYGVTGPSTLKTGQRRREADPEYSVTRHRLQHVWWIEWVDAIQFYEASKTSIDYIVLIDASEIERAKKASKDFPQRFFTKDVAVAVTHHTKVIGSEYLEDIVDEYDLAQTGLSVIPVVRYSANFSETHRTGIVEDMIGPQEVFNWMRSSVINILKLMPNAGYIIKKDLENYSAYLEETMGQSAVVLDESKAGGGITQMKPPVFPGGLQAMSDLSKGEIREVSNVRTENPEQDSKSASGRAVIAKQLATQTGISPYLRNYDRTLRILGNLITLITSASDVISDNEIYSIVEESSLIDDQLLNESRAVVMTSTGVNPQPPQHPDGAKYEGLQEKYTQSLAQTYVQQVQVFEATMQKIDSVAIPMAQDALLAAFRNPLAGKYNCVVSLSPYGVTQRMLNMAALTEFSELLATSGYEPIPEAELYRASDLPNVEKIMAAKGLE